MGLALVTAPSEEPISRTEAKAHLRVTHTAEDTLIDSLIVAARGYAEQFLGRQLVTATWDLKLPTFPVMPCPLLIPRPPLQSVTSITYTDDQGQAQTLSSDDYIVETANVQGRIWPAYDEDWPTTRLGLPDQVVIRFVAGYGAASTVPTTIKQALLLLVGHWYEHREAVSDGGREAELPMAVDSLLWMHRVMEIA
jgi:uncharacterized phiE125 gp8 family phage protein